MHAYRVGFTEALTRILEIAAGVALAGAVAAFALVRQSDFVTPDQPEPASGSHEAVGVAA